MRASIPVAFALLVTAIRSARVWRQQVGTFGCEHATTHFVLLIRTDPLSSAFSPLSSYVVVPCNKFGLETCEGLNASVVGRNLGCNHSLVLADGLI